MAVKLSNVIVEASALACPAPAQERYCRSRAHPARPALFPDRGSMVLDPVERR